MLLSRIKQSKGGDTSAQQEDRQNRSGKRYKGFCASVGWPFLWVFHNWLVVQKVWLLVGINLAVSIPALIKPIFVQHMALKPLMKLKTLVITDDSPTTILIRIMVGGIFMAEGIQKFLYPEELAAGRFAKIGIPAPELMGPFVGGAETWFGLLILLGCMTRLSTLPLLVTMAVAMLSTKIPVLIGQGFWGFTLKELPRYGFLSMLHDARNDLCLIFGLIFLAIEGGGRWSVDRRWFDGNNG